MVAAGLRACGLIGFNAAKRTDRHGGLHATLNPARAF